MAIRYARAMAAPAFLAVFLVSACAGTKVGSIQQSTTYNAIDVPRTIAVVVNNQSPPPRKEKHRARQLADATKATQVLATNLQQTLTAHHLQVVPIDRQPDLILRCDITDVTGGNEAVRVLIGYGAGKAVLKVDVSLIDPSTQAQPLLTFQADSTTGGMPGSGYGLASGNAVQAGGAALGLPKAMKQGLDQELDATTKSIDGQLNKYFAARNWPYVSIGQTAEKKNFNPFW